MNKGSSQVENQSLREDNTWHIRSIWQQFLNWWPCQHKIDVVDKEVHIPCCIQKELIGQEACLWLICLLDQIHVVDEETHTCP